MQRLLAVVAVLTLSVAARRPKWHELEGYTFEHFVRDFGRPYKRGTDEYAEREKTFLTRLAVVQEHNRDRSMSWRRGINMFSDWTAEEWRAYNRPKRSFAPTPDAPVRTIRAENGAPLPMEVDYRTWTSPRVLTAVKHQGQCGSCWAHSAAESFESYYALLTGMLPVLSTQQINSCTGLGTAGCNGGLARSAFTYISQRSRGLTEEWAYPYTDFFSVNGETAECVNTTNRFPNKKPYTWFAELNRVGCDGFVDVTQNDAQATMTALAHHGPLSISVAAGNWQDYESGVMNNTDAFGPDNEWSIDHDVQMVGYGYDKELGLKYWIVRNSWSTLWGEDGFVRLLRPEVEPCSPESYGPVCGVSGCLNGPSFPIVKENPPQPF